MAMFGDVGPIVIAHVREETFLTDTFILTTAPGL
jgi:hypothetical protein